VDVPPLVLKLGGSLISSPRMAAVLQIVCAATIPIVVVPGGGPFADAVRKVQPLLNLDDELAHRLALLSMHQMALVIASHHHRFRPTETLTDIKQTLASKQIPVWMPYALQHDDPTLPADWTVTSDAIAARLAERLGGYEVVLFKSCEIPKFATLDSLMSVGIIDPYFKVIVTRASLPWQLYGSSTDDAFATRLQPRPHCI
jgi:5-(aminomethyl)-3-furanmethanol phosphate kinase